MCVHASQPSGCLECCHALLLAVKLEKLVELVYNINHLHLVIHYQSQILTKVRRWYFSMMGNHTLYSSLAIKVCKGVMEYLDIFQLIAFIL